MISRPRGGMRVAFWSFLCPAPDLVSSLQYTQNFESKKLWVFSADRNSHALAVSREGHVEPAVILRRLHYWLRSRWECDGQRALRGWSEGHPARSREGSAPDQVPLA